MEPSLPPSPGDIECDIIEEDAAQVRGIWKNTLVGFFVGSEPNHFSVKHPVTKAWKRIKEVEFYSF